MNFLKESIKINKINCVFVISLFMISLLLSSCTNTGFGWNNGDRDPNTVKLNEFRKGTDGIKIAFLDKLPPDQISDGDVLKAVLTVHNTGASDIEYGKTILLSTDSNVAIVPSVREYNLRGKNMYFTEGEKTNNEFQIEVRGAGDSGTSLIAYSCYPYQTKLVDSMCVDPTVGKAVIADKACEMKDMSFSGGQGAPVSVTGIKVSPLYQGENLKLRLNITVENTDGGKVVSRDIASAECAMYGTENKVDEVVDVDVEISDGRATCKKYLEGLNDIKSKKGSIICTTGTINKQYASNSPVVITLYYGYVSKEITKKISIMK